MVYAALPVRLAGNVHELLAGVKLQCLSALPVSVPAISRNQKVTKA